MSDNWREMQERAEAMNEKVFRGTIIPFLIEKGVDRVTAAYDGSGDDGQLDIEGYWTEEGESVDLDDDLKFDQMHVGYAHEDRKHSLMARPESVDRIIEDYLGEILEKHYGGWEINEGSRGTIILFLQTGEYQIDHESRYEAYHHFSHSGSI